MSSLLEASLYTPAFIFRNSPGKNILKENEPLFDILKPTFEDHLARCHDSATRYRGNTKRALIGYKYLMECFGTLWISRLWGHYFRVCDLSWH